MVPDTILMLVEYGDAGDPKGCVDPLNSTFTSNPKVAGDPY